MNARSPASHVKKLAQAALAPLATASKTHHHLT